MEHNAMRRTGLREMSVGFVMLALTGASPAYAQTAASPPETQSTQVKTIFDFKAELGLTDKQETEIREILADLNKEVQLTRAKLTILSFELEDLVKKQVTLEQIKKNLKDQADLQANMRFADMVATMKIDKVLSSEQLSKWRRIQASAREAPKPR